MLDRTKRAGITWVELLVVVAIIGILIAMLMPAVQSAHTPARRTMCRNNLKHLALAALSYESVHMELPMGVGIKDQNGVLKANPVSGLIALLPFLEQREFYDEISSPMVIGRAEYPAFEASLADVDYPPWVKKDNLFICPSSVSTTSKFGRTSYAFSAGDVARNVSKQETLRGAFGYFKANRMDDIADGTSNTVGIIEIGGDKVATVRGGCFANGKAAWLDKPEQVYTVIKDNDYAAGVKLIDRGSHWADGRAGVGLANTILPFNSPSFQVQGSPTADGVYSAGAGHKAGGHVAMLDGSTHFIPEDIDTGDGAATLTVEQMTAGVPSPHGVWGALGTIASGDDTQNWDRY